MMLVEMWKGMPKDIHFVVPKKKKKKLYYLFDSGLFIYLLIYVILIAWSII